MKRIFCFTFLCFAFFLKAQPNLVPNGSFENYSLCPTGISQITRAQFWIQPTGNTPDYFNSCNGNSNSVGVPCNFLGVQNAHLGNAFAGFTPYYNCVWNCREYIEVPLTDTLRANVKYCVSFYLSLADSSYNAIAPIGAYFSKTLVDSQATIEYLSFTPQVVSASQIALSDTSNWMLVCDSFVAQGGEKYLVIGSFVPDSQLTIVNVRPNPFNYKGAYYYIDDVSVIDCDSLVGLPEYARSSFSLYPNPSSGNFNLKGDFPANAQLHVFNLLGEEMNSPIELPQGNQSFPFSVNLAEGIYVCRVIAAGEILHEEKLVIVR